MINGLIGRLLGEEEISAKTTPESLSQLRWMNALACTCVQFVESKILGPRTLPTRGTTF
jgi:hypothetical protein